MYTFCPKCRNLSLSAAMSIPLFTIPIRHLPPSVMWGNLFRMYTEYDMANPHSDLGNSPRFALILVTIARFVRSATALVWLWYTIVGLVSIPFFLSHDVRFFERYSPPKSHRRLTALHPDMVSRSVMSSCRFCSTPDLLQIARAITNVEKSSQSDNAFVASGVLLKMAHILLSAKAPLQPWFVSCCPGVVTVV